MSFPDEIKMIKFEYQGQPHEIPLDSFSAAIDKILLLARLAKKTGIPGVFNWFNDEIQIPVTDFEFPLANDPEDACAHLLSYGILDGFKFEFPAKKCKTLYIPDGEIRFYNDSVKTANIRFYEYIYIAYLSGGCYNEKD